MDKKLDTVLVKESQNEEQSGSNEKQIYVLSQWERLYNIRVHNFTVPEADSTSAIAATNYVFTNLISPIMKLAVEDGVLSAIPGPLEVVDTCHMIKQKQGKIVHLRFRSKLYREIVFRYKAQYFQKSGSSCSIFEDLCKENRDLLNSTKERDDVLRAWNVFVHGFRSGCVQHLDGRCCTRRPSISVACGARSIGTRSSRSVSVLYFADSRGVGHQHDQTEGKRKKGGDGGFHAWNVGRILHS